MITLYADASGAVRRLIRSGIDDTLYPDPPAGTASTLTFDETTNAALLADLLARQEHYQLTTVSGSPTLARDGQAVTIAAPGTEYTERQQIRQALTAFLTGQTTLTAAQVQVVLRYILRQFVRHDWL